MEMVRERLDPSVLCVRGLSLTDTTFKYVPSGPLSAAREGTERGGGPGCCLYCMGMLAALATAHTRAECGRTGPRPLSRMPLGYSFSLALWFRM